jgi:azurin
MTRHIALLTLLLAAGCSTPPASNPVSPATSPSTAAPATTAPQPRAGRAIEITASDTMKFSVVEIAAAPGETLSVTLVNVGTTPKFSMGHNWVLLAAGADPLAFVVAAAEAVTTDYVPAAKAQVLAATKLLGPKERDTVTFTAPAAPGRYEFLCSFPGHFQVGMRGVLIVQ